MKRAAAALVMLGLGAAASTPVMASTTVYGSAQLKYTVNATASVSIAVNYDASGNIQSGVASTILPSTAGNCSAGVAEGTNATLTFGGITPPVAGYTGCYYKNALSVGVLSNDANGVQVWEYVDTLATGTQVCAFPLNATLANAPAASGATGNPAAYSASCPTVNAIAGQALAGQGPYTVGTGFGAPGTPGGVTTDVTTTPTSTQAGGVGYKMFDGTGNSGAAWKFLGEDLQMNVAGSASSGAATNVITVAVVPK